MRKALDMMEGERLLTRRQGRGTFVNDQSSDELAVRYSNIRTADGERITGEVKVLSMVQGAANATEAARLRLRQDDKVWRIQRVRLHKGEPFMVEDVVMPAALFPDLDEQKDVPSRIVVLAQQYGILLGKGDERVSIGGDRLVQDLGGRAVEWRVGMGHFADKYYLAEIS
jgi:GntR family transcriptional regulator